MSQNYFEIYYSPSYYSDNINLELENIEEHRDYLYFRCPVWNHLFHRTFVLKSPVDFELKFLDENVLQYTVDNFDSQIINFADEKWDRNTYQTQNLTAYIPDILKKRPIIQVSFADFYIWTPPELNYVWFEFSDHPLTSVNNNFVSLSGWFNVANHPRNTSLGIKFIDKTKPVTIKKGDPLHRVRFYTEDLNQIPVLIKKDLSEFPDMMGETVSMIRKNPEFLKSLLFEKNIKEKINV